MARKNTTKITGKEFVLDTNILINEPSAMFGFGKHDVTIPIQTLEELDRFKSGQDMKGDSAREVSRQIDALYSEKLYTVGVSLGEGKGKLRIYLLTQMNTDVRKALREDTKDHRIISVALNRKEIKGQTKEVILVSNDINLRLKAGSFGLKVEGRKADRIEDISGLYKGKMLIETDEELVNINKAYKEKTADPAKLINFLKRQPLPNEFFLIKTSSNSIMLKYVESKKLLEVVQEDIIYGKVKARNIEQKFALDAILDPEISLITFTGKAGTGKTLVAIGAAIKTIKDYDQLLIARPIVPLSNKDLGFLPGDAKEKVGPYMQPLFDNIRVLKKNNGQTTKTSEKIDTYLQNEKIVIEPLAFIRGRTFNNTLLIVDEAQNLTPKEVKTIVTRMGNNSKVIFTGDIHQIDHPYIDAHSNGLTYLIANSKFYEKAAHVEFEKGERSDLAEWASENL